MIADGMTGLNESEIVERLAAGDVRVLARAVSLVEDGAESAAGLLAACRALGRNARRIGVTGPPGAGKSTLVDQMVRFLRAKGGTVGVVAVDPSSPYTGGALLGDRIRMQGFVGDAGVYIRSMASRGALGGLAATAAGVCTVMEAAGFGTVIVETVGVGQDEVAVAGLADVTILVLVPGMGDDVQSLKAGVMEVADIFAVNKSDQPGAERVEAEILATQGLAMSVGWVPPAVRTVGTTGEGVAALMGAVERCLVGRVKRATANASANANAGVLRIAQDDGVKPATARATAPTTASATADSSALLRNDKHEGRNDKQEGRNDKQEGCGPALDHLGIAVRSLAAAKEFYALLGMAVTHEETVEHEQVKTAMLPLGGSRIELLEPTVEDSTIGRFLAKRGEGLHHIAIRVDRLDERFTEMQAAGVRLASERVRVGVGGHRYFFVHPASTGGVLVELVGE